VANPAWRLAMGRVRQSMPPVVARLVAKVYNGASAHLHSCEVNAMPGQGEPDLSAGPGRPLDRAQGQAAAAGEEIDDFKPGADVENRGTDTPKELGIDAIGLTPRGALTRLMLGLAGHRALSSGAGGSHRSRREAQPWRLGGGPRLAAADHAVEPSPRHRLRAARALRASSARAAIPRRSSDPGRGRAPGPARRRLPKGPCCAVRRWLLLARVSRARDLASDQSRLLDPEDRREPAARSKGLRCA
jgi:hypothetical protein